jgi:hypothetical protein
MRRPLTLIPLRPLTLQLWLKTAPIVKANVSHTLAELIPFRPGPQKSVNSLKMRRALNPLTQQLICARLKKP